MVPLGRSMTSIATIKLMAKCAEVPLSQRREFLTLSFRIIQQTLHYPEMKFLDCKCDTCSFASDHLRSQLVAHCVFRWWPHAVMSYKYIIRFHANSCSTAVNMLKVSKAFSREMAKKQRGMWDSVWWGCFQQSWSLQNNWWNFRISLEQIG